MKNYNSKLDATGTFFLTFFEDKFPHVPITQKVVLHILSLQKALIWDVDRQVWKIERKSRQGGTLNLEKFVSHFSTSEN